MDQIDERIQIEFDLCQNSLPNIDELSCHIELIHMWLECVKFNNNKELLRKIIKNTINHIKRVDKKGIYLHKVDTLQYLAKHMI